MILELRNKRLKIFFGDIVEGYSSNYFSFGHLKDSALRKSLPSTYEDPDNPFSSLDYLETLFYMLQLTEMIIAEYTRRLVKLFTYVMTICAFAI